MINCTFLCWREETAAGKAIAQENQSPVSVQDLISSNAAIRHPMALVAMETRRSIMDGVSKLLSMAPKLLLGLGQNACVKYFAYETADPEIAQIIAMVKQRI